MRKKHIALVAASIMAITVLLAGCGGTADNTEAPVNEAKATKAPGNEAKAAETSAKETKETKKNTEAAEASKGSSDQNAEPELYGVTTALKEDAAIDPETGTGLYIRYTELTINGDAPETFKSAVAQCNARAEEAAMKRLAAVPGGEPEPNEKYSFETYAYIVTVTRADSEAFSILETEYEEGLPDMWSGPAVSYSFHGTTYETKSGKEIALSDLTDEGEACAGMLRGALESKYGVEDLADVDPEDYSWTADALGIRFYFNSDAVSKEKRRERNDYTNNAVTVAFPYDALTGAKADEFSVVPDSYIAMIERETVYDLPYGDLSIMLTQSDGNTVIRMMPDSGDESELIIEYADETSDFYIIRSKGGFYLFRQREAYQEGFFYDFAKPDGGYGRFAYNNAQYFDSFLREIDLALPYDPACAHMCEIRRSFGEVSYDSGSFIPNGHYSFPDDPDGRYKRFELIGGKLQVDSRNVACRLLEDTTFTELDAEGNEIGDITAKAGDALIFESLTGEADRYQIPTQRNNTVISLYDCRLSDGTKVRFETDAYSVVSKDGGYLTRFTKPISLAEAKFVVSVEDQDVFTVHIGDKDYPLIPDYSKKNHTGEEIDFGDDIWWQVEGYVGTYEMTEEDKKDMEDGWFTDDALSRTEGTATLVISEDGHAVFDYFGEVFEGEMPEKRYYREDVYIDMDSSNESRTFQIILREGEDHSEPQRIEFYSGGLPATNEPSKVLPLSVYLTKE